MYNDQQYTYSISVLVCNDYYATTVDYLRQRQDGFGCGDKHNVVNSDVNSAKHNNVNIGCKDITFIISRYFRTAGT